MSESDKKQEQPKKPKTLTEEDIVVRRSSVGQPGWGPDQGGFATPTDVVQGPGGRGPATDVDA